MNAADAKVAYFSMEVALENDIPTYAGGLGVLAGDMLRQAADAQFPMVGVTLVHSRGYFRQRLDPAGHQREQESPWIVSEYATPVAQRVRVELEGRAVVVGAWRYDVKGTTGYVVPVYLLETDLPENAPEHRGLTYHLYGGDDRYRLCQEAVLGIGGVRLLRALGFKSLARFHMNEGHAALLGLELLREGTGNHPDKLNMDTLEQVRSMCVFTTHTPVPAGHDQFPMELVHRVLGPREEFRRPELRNVICCDGMLNMTHLALALSCYVNGVARRHGEVSRSMFPGFPIESITNGIHCERWASEPMRRLFDRYVPGWRQDNFTLRYIKSVPAEEIERAHGVAKQALVERVIRESTVRFDPEAFTVGYGRRFTAYKRPEMLFHDPQKLRRIAREIGPLQIVYAGKAHPRDEEGKDLIRRVIEAGRSLGDAVRFGFLTDYDMDTARALISGVDLWLNTPQPPLEASGTSGMKAALNGVPSLSVLDGWWIEGHYEGVTGWAIGSPSDTPEAQVEALYTKLETACRMFYRDRGRYSEMRRAAIAVNASFFNTERMLEEYVTRAYHCGRRL